MKKLIAVLLAITLIISACSFAVYAAKADGDEPVGCVSWFENTLNWDKVYMYAWNEYGGALCGEWPGNQIKDTTTTYEGKTYYIVEIPENADGVIFNSGIDSQGACSQTQVINDHDYGMYFYPDGTVDDMGYYVVKGGYIDDLTLPRAPVPENIYFINSQKFENVYLYSWDDSGDALTGAWPGTPLSYFDKDSDTGYEVYYFEIPYNANGFVLSDGNTKKTECVFNITDRASYWLDGSKDENGDYLFKPYNIIVPTTEPEIETKTIYVSDDINWGIGFLYAWDENRKSLTKAWPGDQVAMTNINGKSMFVCEVPVNAEGFIVSNGKGSMTVDILDFADYNAFRIIDENTGAYKVEGYNIEFPPVPEVTLGDVSGDGLITVSDATLVQQHAADIITLEGTALAAADTNKDGIISVSDATLIQQRAAEMIDSF